MANAIPRLIRCPKCLKILSEIPGAAVYKCGGCGSILRAKVNSSSGKTSSSASAASSSKNMSDAGSLEHERSDFGKETQSASYHSGGQDQVVKAKVSGANGELSIRHEFSENGVKNSAESDTGSSKEKRRSLVYEQNGVNLTEHSFNGTGKKSSGHAISPQHVDEDDKILRKIRNESSFLMRSRSSHVNSPQKTISRFDYRGRQQGISFSSEDFRSALNLMASENGATSESYSKDPEQFAKFRHSEKIDQARILRKVDELRIDLRRLFGRGADDNGASRLSVSARFEGKIPPIQHPSSFVPPSEQPPTSYRPHNAHSHLPAGGGAAPSHPLDREPHSAKKSDKRSHDLKCYCRPVSGGAPFVICNRCYNLIRLPTDFLMLAKRVHKLRCGVCAEVLSYTFRPKARPAAQTPSEARLPPSEDEKSLGEALDVEISAAPRLNYIREGDPVSYSEDYHLPSSGKSSSNGGIVEEDHGGKRLRRSKLHRLMGYSSARFLLFNTFSSSEGGRTEQDR